MPYNDLRDFMETLREKNDLKNVQKEVDRKFEIASVTKRSLNEGGPALLFENVRGFKTPVVTGLMGTIERCLLAFETTLKDWPEKFSRAVEDPVPPKIVKDGPCKEVVKMGKEVDMNKFPILWHSEKDAGYYISSGISIMKDPDTGIRNAGIYRALVMDRDNLSVFMNVPQDGRVIAKKYMDRGEPCPVAIVVGMDPAIVNGAAIKTAYGVDELGVVSSLRGQPLEMVKCGSIDLEVPATAELVIEGEFLPGKEEGAIGKSIYTDEAPFGEYTGYYGKRRRSPVLHIKCVAHREDMVYHGLVIGKPPGESGKMYAALRWVEAYEAVSQVIPKEHIRGIHIPAEAGNMKCIVSIKKTRPMQGKLVAAAVLAREITVKKVVVVDEDIDPFNLTEVLWAEESRARTEDIFAFEATGSSLDPMAREECIIPKIGIDATLPLGGDKPGDLEILLELGPVKLREEGIDLKDYI